MTKSGQLIPIGLSMNEFHLNEEMLFVAVMHDLRTATGKTEEEYTGMLFHELRNPFSRVSNGIDFLLYRLQVCPGLGTAEECSSGLLPISLEG